MRRLRLWTLQEPQVERREHQDDSGIDHQPLPEPVPEEQDVHADHDGYQREDIKDAGYPSSHTSFLLRGDARVKRDYELAARVEGRSSLARIGIMVHLTAPTIHAGQRAKDIVARAPEDPKRKQAFKDASLGPTINRDLLKKYAGGLPQTQIFEPNSSTVKSLIGKQ